MTSLSSRCFDSRIEPCANLCAWIEHFCEKTKTSAHNTWQLTLVLEELFANSVKHGYPGLQHKDNLSVWPVWIELTHSAEGVHVQYEDESFEFNPLENVNPPDYSGPPESWRIGGLGLSMVAGIATNMRYERIANRNRLSLTLPAKEK